MVSAKIDNSVLEIDYPFEEVAPLDKECVLFFSQQQQV